MRFFNKTINASWVPLETFSVVATPFPSFHAPRLSYNLFKNKIQTINNKKDEGKPFIKLIIKFFF